MQLQKLSLIAGAFALSLTAMPFAVKAETISSSPIQIAQTPTQAPRKGEGKFNRLGLTDAQKAQMAEIRRETKAQMEAILTPQQREQLQTARQNRQGKRQVWRNLNLTDAQRNQMRQIMQTQKSKMEAILTSEQRQRLEEFRQNRQNMRSRRQQMNNSNP
jgi:periplasmic protein CpxP/Spy